MQLLLKAIRLCITWSVKLTYPVVRECNAWVCELERPDVHKPLAFLTQHCCNTSKDVSSTSLFPEYRLCLQPLVQTPKGRNVPIIMAPQVVGIMLRLLMACDDANERLYTLETLCFLIGADMPFTLRVEDSGSYEHA